MDSGYVPQTYFGVELRSLDDGKIEQLLTYYGRLPRATDRNVRLSEFVGLFITLSPSEIERIKGWYHDNGELPRERSSGNRGANLEAARPQRPLVVYGHRRGRHPTLLQGNANLGGRVPILDDWEYPDTPLGAGPQSNEGPLLGAARISGRGSNRGKMNGNVASEIRQTSASSKVECPLCVTDKPPSEFPTNDKVCCQTLAHICCECTHNYIATSIELYDVKNIRCFACRKPFTPSQIKDKVPEATWKRQVNQLYKP